MAQYKVVFIDWYGTLSKSNFWGHWEDLGHPRHDQFARIEALWAGDLSPLLIPWMRGDLTAEGFVSAMALKLELDHDQMMREFIFSCENMQLISPEVATSVRALQQQGVKVVIATDNMDCFTRWTAPALGLDRLFDGILNSHYLESLKHEADNDGNSGFFSRFLAEHNLGRGECVLIDDSPILPEPMAQWGIDYRKITFGEGLIGELDRIIAA